MAKLIKNINKVDHSGYLKALCECGHTRLSHSLVNVKPDDPRDIPCYCTGEILILADRKRFTYTKRVLCKCNNFNETFESNILRNRIKQERLNNALEISR